LSVKRSPSFRPRLWIAPLAAASLVLCIGTAGWAKGHKADKKKQTAGATVSAKPAATATTAGAVRPKATPGKKKKPGSKGVEAPSKRKKLRPEVAAIIRADNYARQGHGVVEGDLAEPLAGATCPGGMQTVEQRFCVDPYEGALVEVTGGGETAWSPYEMPIEGRTYKATSTAGAFPQGYISGVQAQAACMQAGKRLCKPVEWRTACMGPKKQLWGYSASRTDNACNDRGRSPMLHFYPEVNTSWKLVGMTEMNDARLNQLDGSLMKTGASPQCTNEYGVYDMVGNLHEWTSDPNGTFQGGYYLDTHQNGDGCGYRTTAHEFAYHDYSTGFRCCADVVAPASTPAASATTATPTPSATPTPPATPSPSATPTPSASSRN
jgi:hypothetical protein